MDIQINDLLKPVLLKDLRIQCRARGLNPAGSKESLVDRLTEHMKATGDLTLVAEFNGEACPSVPVATSGVAPATAAAPALKNNYTRPEGQNCGNFLTDRPSSRVLAPPGGGTHFSLGDPSYTSAPEPTAKATVTLAAQPKVVEAYAPAEPAIAADEPADGSQPVATGHNNNYTRPQGQNVGNFLTDRPSSRVLAPPGGGSQITFG